MKKSFGILPSGEEAFLYTISCDKLTAVITDYGASLVRLYVPDSAGKVSDVVLGYEDVNGYRTGTTYFGATVGRNANRVGKACFPLNGQTVQLADNDGGNNLHSGPDSYAYRLWQVEEQTDSTITFVLHSPHGDQGFPGNATVHVTYSLENPGNLRLRYSAVSDRDTVFNLTNHTYFNLAGHEHPEKAMEQTLIMPARFFTPADEESIPTGECRSVDGTPMDFRIPKAIGAQINADYDALNFQGGYDHNFEVFCNPCAILSDSASGRSMSVTTSCPGVQFYSGNYLKDQGKDGIYYPKRGGICLETQFFPNSVNYPHWKQPIVKAGETYRSETVYSFSW